MKATVTAEEIHRLAVEQNKQVFIAATGAGAGVQNLLWQNPGASAYLVGSCFPYSKEALGEFLGLYPEKSVSEMTAVWMAMRAYTKALNKDGSGDAIGIGATAAVSTNRELRGGRRIHMAVMSKTQCTLYPMCKLPNNTDRITDGDFCDQFILERLWNALFEHPLDTHLEDAIDANDLATRLYMATPCIHPGGTRTSTAKINILFPGAFNPPHEGHRRIVEVMNKTVWHEISIDHPHKPPLTIQEMLRRERMLEGNHLVFSQGAPLYTDKMKRYNCDIIMGEDALERMIDSRWGETKEQIVFTVSSLGRKVYVVPRGTLLAETDYFLKYYQHLFPRLDVDTEGFSSTNIREASNA